MQETEVMQQVAAILGDLKALGEQAGKFVMEQAPPLAREIVTYGRVADTGFAIVGAVLASQALCLLNGKAIRKAGKENWDNDEAVGIVRCVVRGAAGVVGLMLLCLNLQDALLAWFAPRLYLLEYVKHLIRGGGCR